MIDATWITWVLIIFGLVTCLPLLAAQLLMITKPDSQKAKDILIGKGEEWRDAHHKKTALGLAWADWLIFIPIFLTGTFGVILGSAWGYILWGISGAIQLYINTFLWFFEREFVLPANGSFAYYTYIWGNFIYWGAASVIYTLIRLSGLYFTI